MNEIKQTLQQDADALLKRLQQSRKNGTGVTLGVSDVGVLCEVLGGEYLVVKKEVIENWYLDEGEYVWYEKDSIDSYLEDLDNGEVLEVQRKEYVVINSNPVFATNVYEDADNIQWELFDSKDEAEKAAAHCKAMIEAAQENSHE
ncbi:hypothetical protein [uncultured Acinetobacter sp.]|uniref:hypothetical protein n=1 Tax=uncultured Acinetobacter sp. TaxID=165433 RepID=UPI002584423F|nr:hypothetical protein [uncultured Acinetobacter sp.]